MGYPSKRWLVKEEGEKWWVELGGRYGLGGKYSHTVAHTAHNDHNIRGAVNTHTYLAKYRDQRLECSPLGSHPVVY